MAVSFFLVIKACILPRKTHELATALSPADPANQIVIPLVLGLLWYLSSVPIQALCCRSSATVRAYYKMSHFLPGTPSPGPRPQVSPPFPTRTEILEFRTLSTMISLLESDHVTQAEKRKSQKRFGSAINALEKEDHNDVDVHLFKLTSRFLRLLIRERGERFAAIPGLPSTIAVMKRGAQKHRECSGPSAGGGSAEVHGEAVLTPGTAALRRESFSLKDWLLDRSNYVGVQTGTVPLAEAGGRQGELLYKVSFRAHLKMMSLLLRQAAVTGRKKIPDGEMLYWWRMLERYVSIACCFEIRRRLERGKSRLTTDGAGKNDASEQVHHETDERKQGRKHRKQGRNVWAYLTADYTDLGIVVEKGLERQHPDLSPDYPLSNDMLEVYHALGFRDDAEKNMYDLPGKWRLCCGLAIALKDLDRCLDRICKASEALGRVVMGDDEAERRTRVAELDRAADYLMMSMDNLDGFLRETSATGENGWRSIDFMGRYLRSMEQKHDIRSTRSAFSLKQDPEAVQMEKPKKWLMRKKGKEAKEKQISQSAVIPPYARSTFASRGARLFGLRSSNAKDACCNGYQCHSCSTGESLSAKPSLGKYSLLKARKRDTSNLDCGHEPPKRPRCTSQAGLDFGWKKITAQTLARTSPTILSS